MGLASSGIVAASGSTSVSQARSVRAFHIESFDFS